MTAILRHAPGETAPRDGMFVLVGHYGESTNIAIWRAEGESFPLVVANENLGRLWYVRVEKSGSVSQAA